MREIIQAGRDLAEIAIELEAIAERLGSEWADGFAVTLEEYAQRLLDIRREIVGEPDVGGWPNLSTGDEEYPRLAAAAHRERALRAFGVALRALADGQRECPGVPMPGLIEKLAADFERIVGFFPPDHPRARLVDLCVEHGTQYVDPVPAD